MGQRRKKYLGPHVREYSRFEDHKRERRPHDEDRKAYFKKQMLGGGYQAFMTKMADAGVRMEPTESELHGTIAHFLGWLLPSPAVWTTFPAGGYSLSRASAGILRHKGLKPGMPDILCFHQGRCIGIELKTRANQLTKIQLGMHQRLEDAGVHCYVCRSLADVVDALKREGFPLKPFKDASYNARPPKKESSHVESSHGDGVIADGDQPAHAS